jgi:hypothetical protein
MFDLDVWKLIRSGASGDSRARPVSPIMRPLASKPRGRLVCMFLRQARRFSEDGQLYVKLPQLRRNGTVIKVSNLRVPKE